MDDNSSHYSINYPASKSDRPSVSSVDVSNNKIYIVIRIIILCFTVSII